MRTNRLLIASMIAPLATLQIAAQEHQHQTAGEERVLFDRGKIHFLRTVDGGRRFGSFPPGAPSPSRNWRSLD